VDSIPDIDGKCVANCICHVASSNDNAEANARLIAAAPDMLEALEEIVFNVTKNFEGSIEIRDPEAIEMAREAIRKAKGEAIK
jgi:hypothetical protein